MTPLYQIILPHTELTAMLRRLLRTPGSIAIGRVGLSQSDTAIELLGHRFHAATPAWAEHEPAMVVGLSPDGDRPFADAAALLDRYQATGPAVGLALAGRGRSTAIDARVRLGDGRLEPVRTVRVVGPGMAVLHPGDRETPAGPAGSERWSRLTQALGYQVWERLRGCCFAIVGCGRTGSQVAMTLARMEVAEIALVDPDTVELHNLDAMDGVVATDVGRAKVDALAEALRRVSPTLRVQACAASITALAALPLIKRSQVIISCTDDDGARWAAGTLATLYLKPHLDIGTGIFDRESIREMGADVRLILPGEGCVVCYGGFARPGQVRALRRSHANEVHARTGRVRSPERAGSLRSLNQIAAGLGTRLLEDLFAARVRGSRWSRLTFSAHGAPALESFSRDDAANCSLCHLRGMGDSGLIQIPRLPNIIGAN